ncbi:Crp/Fnr family transcriptional regulator [Phytohabitans sp. LJ34]|uniref:Crp/Fnr family transcriptional regulator n=1 Tax=Phytohabitans sp. LJ34 TaxID=3452217 RepID=UPI003F8A2B4D
MVSGLFDYPGDEDGGSAAAGREPAADTGVLLREATAADWALIGEHAQPRRYEPGERIFAANDAERCLWIVAAGRVTVASGRHVVDELGPGGVFGELTFLTGEPARSTVHAATEATVLRLSLAGFEVLAGKDPTLARHLLFDLAQVLAVRLHRLRRLVGG